MWIRLLLALALSLGAAATCAETLAGRVIAVTDGDTLTMLVSDRSAVIRLDGIDAPEKTQPFGAASKRSLSDRAFGRDAVATCHKVDRYGRRVCAVTVDGRDLALLLITGGHAWFYVKYAHELQRERRAVYEAAEGAARGARTGLWIDDLPTPPWEWRRASRPNSRHHDHTHP